MKITQIPMGAHNAQLTCYLQDPCTEMPALDRCPAILIFPGGAYAFCSDREADPVALAFLNAGYNAFVLRYSVSQNCPVEEVYTNAFAEAQEAMDYLHQNAGDLHIDPEQIAVVGFSAGGHLAASVGTMGRVRPAAMLLGYAVFSVPGKALGMELPDLLQQVDDCWVSVKQFSKNDTATACQDWLRSTRLGRGSIKSHVRTVKVLGMGLFAFQERVHLWKGVTH